MCQKLMWAANVGSSGDEKHLDDLGQVDDEGAGVFLGEPDVGVPAAFPLALALAHIPQVRHQLQRLKGRMLPGLQVTAFSAACDLAAVHVRCNNAQSMTSRCRASQPCYMHVCSRATTPQRANLGPQLPQWSMRGKMSAGGGVYAALPGQAGSRCLPSESPRRPADSLVISASGQEISSP